MLLIDLIRNTAHSNSNNPLPSRLFNPITVSSKTKVRINPRAINRANKGPEVELLMPERTTGMTGGGEGEDPPAMETKKGEFCSLSIVYYSTVPVPAPPCPAVYRDRNRSGPFFSLPVGVDGRPVVGGTGRRWTARRPGCNTSRSAPSCQMQECVGVTKEVVHRR